ncbi:ankyrin [Setomelanomma holmii]|uniref:Ankyrin n=1 Tax=Setomelanomma holmii TaxID=210430 RepID=A0A9P4LMR6_9PLEO|nr:ankyrin [Setomelanomma holmii]
MADPLSAVGSVAGLVSLAIQLAQLSYQYVSGIKGSSKAWSTYIQELSTLTSVLLKLQQASDHADAPNLAQILPSPGVSANSIRECHNELSDLKSTLSEKLLKKGLRRKLEMLAWPFSEFETQKKVLMLHRFSSLFGSALVADSLTVSVESYRHLKNEREIKDFNELLNWFKPKYDFLPLPPEVILEPVCPGSRADLLSSSTYVDWRDSSGATTNTPMWINGPPGAGKSVLCATIVNDILNQANTLVAHHFFKDSQEETLQDVLRHIAYQLLSQPTAVSQIAVNICEKKMVRNASLVPKDLLDVICDVSSTSGRVYIILDGLDEFAQSAKLLKYLPQFVAAKAKVVISSCDLPSIATHMANAKLIDARAESHDIELYAQWRFEEDSDIDEVLLTDAFQRDVAVTVAEQCKGSFLLARLVMNAVCDATTIKKIRNVLDHMPSTFEGAYKDTFDRILRLGQDRQALALAALCWVCNAKRSLDTNELQHAIASLEDIPEYTPESLEPATAILTSCLGLLVHSRSSQSIGLVHISAREFVLKQLSLEAQYSRIAVGRACIKYLSVPIMARGRCQSLDELKTRIADMPFLDYATRYYGYHVLSVEDDLLIDLVDFLQDEKFRESTWQILHMVVDIESQSAQELLAGSPTQATILHVACYWGFNSLLKRLLATPLGRLLLSKTDSHAWTALHWASSNGHPRLVANLIKAGADINAVDKALWTPLFWAVVRGHTSVVRLLLERGSTPFDSDYTGFTAVHWAVLAGDSDMTSLLLESGKILDRHHRRGPHDLSFSTCQLTVEEAKLQSVPKLSRNLFKLVIDISDAATFEKLAKSHKRVDLLDIGSETSISSLYDRTKVVMTKGDTRADHVQESPIERIRRGILSHAIQCKDVDLVKSMLILSRDLGKNLDSDVASTFGTGYVHLAARSGSPKVMRLLVDTKLSLRATDSRRFTPLHYACRSGTRKVLEVILESSVDVDALDQHGRTPLMLLLAFTKWRTRHTPGDAVLMFNTLVSKGASIHAKDSAGYQPIHYALIAMDPAILQTLCDLGADLVAPAEELKTPLHVLAEGRISSMNTGNLRFKNDELKLEGYSEKYHTYQTPLDLVETMTKLLLRLSPPQALQAETVTNTTALALAIRNRNWILAQALHAAQAPFSCDGDLPGEFELVAGYGFYELVRVVVEAGGVPPTDGGLIVGMSAMQPAQKQYEWDEDEIDVFGCESSPRVDYVQVLKELSVFGIDINHQDSNFRSTAIQLAAERGIKDRSYLVALLEGGADPYAHRDNGFDSFYLALFCRKLDNLAILVQHAIQDISRDHWLANFLRESGTMPQSDQECFEACVAAIGQSGAYQTYDGNGHTLLFHAVSEGNLTLAHELIKLGSNVGSADYTGWTPFHEAVKLLITQGSDVRWPVETTAPYSVTSSVPPDPDEPLPIINALHIAVGIYKARYETSNRLSPGVMRILLENGMDPNTKAMHVGGLQNCSVWEDSSPLQIMFRSSGPEYSPDFFAVVQLLIDYGADVRGIADGLNIWQIAKFEGYESLWDTLRNAEPVPTE